MALPGRLQKVSEGFAVLRVEASDEAYATAKAVKYNKGVLVFEQVGVEGAIRVREAIDREGELDLLLEFRSLLETDLVLPESPFAVVSTQLKMDLGIDASVYQVLGAIHATFDLFESIRGFVDLAVAEGGVSAAHSPTLRVRELRFQNPLEMILIGAVTVAGGAAYVANRVASTIGSAADAASKVQGVKHERKAEKRRDELHELQVKSLQLDNVKKAIEVGELLERLRPEIAEVAGLEILELPPSSVSHLEALKDQAAEAAVEMEIASGESLEIEIVDDPDDEQA